MLNDKSKAILIQSIADALSPGGFSITVLISLIADYIPYVGHIQTVGIVSGTADALCLATDAPESENTCALVITSLRTVERLAFHTGPPVLYMKGSAHGGWMKADYPRLDAGFTHLKAICTSPEPGVYYLADETAVRVCSADDRVSVVAGERQAGWADGMGPEAQFRDMKAIVCDSKHKQLWLISNLRLRTVFIGSRMVSTIAGDGKISARDGVGTDCSLCDPRDLCFYKSSPSSAAAAAGGKKPESVLFISSSEAIRRFDLNERRMTTLQLKDAPTDFDPMAIACTSGGMLLVTCCETNVMFAVDPITGDVDRIGGDRLTARGKPVAVDGPALTHGRFADPVSITVNDSQQFVLVADGRNARVRSLNLPPHFFADLSK